MGRARAQGDAHDRALFEYYGDDAGWSFEARGPRVQALAGPVAGTRRLAHSERMFAMFGWWPPLHRFPLVMPLLGLGCTRSRAGSGPRSQPATGCSSVSGPLGGLVAGRRVAARCDGDGRRRSGAGRHVARAARSPRRRRRRGSGPRSSTRSGTFGARAAAAAGVELERCAVDPALSRPTGGATVVAALLDGVALVAATVPLQLRLGRRAPVGRRARVSAASVLVALGPWPVEAALPLSMQKASTWSVGRRAGVARRRDTPGARRSEGRARHGRLRAR